MACEEATFSRQHSAVSENQYQHQRPFTAEGTEDAEESKTLPPSHGKPGQANADEQERVKQRAEALAHKLAQTYEELTRLLERNPGMKRQITEGEAKEDKVYQKLKQRLKLADMAPRCRWVRQDGTSCRSPQLKQHIYCFAHRQMAEARTLLLMLPAAEDANAIQMGLMRIQKALIEDTISTKKAGLLLYSMQLALTNVGQTTFGQAKDEEMVRETVDEEEALGEKAVSNQHSAVSQDQTFETQRNGGSGGEEGLRRRDADKRGLQEEENRQEVEFVAVPGGYGFERVRLGWSHRDIGPSHPSPRKSGTVRGSRTSGHRIRGRSEHSRGRQCHTSMLKCTPFWGDMGCGGMDGEGVGRDRDIGESGNRRIVAEGGAPLESGGSRAGKRRSRNQDSRDQEAGEIMTARQSVNRDIGNRLRQRASLVNPLIPLIRISGCSQKYSSHSRLPCVIILKVGR